MVNGIRHPYFRRISKTEYLINDPTNLYHGVMHVGQIFKYLAFDKSLRDGRLPATLPGMPLGYLNFANSFNNGVLSNDTRWLSVISYHNNQEQVTPSSHPVSLRDFAITMEKYGLSITCSNEATNERSALIAAEYAAVMTEQRACWRCAIQEWQIKRQNQFVSSEPRSWPTKKSHYNFKLVLDYHAYPESATSASTESKYSVITDIVNAHQVSTSPTVPESDSTVNHSQSTEFINDIHNNIVEDFIDAITNLPTEELSKSETGKEVGPTDLMAMQV